MPTTEPVNTQQVLQMASHAEKLQQTLQQQALTLTSQLEDERLKTAELKHSEVQDPETPYPSNPANPEGNPLRGRIRRKPPKRVAEVQAGEEITAHLPERSQGDKIDLVV